MLVTVKVDLRQVNSMLSRQGLALRDQRAMWRAALVVFYSHTSEVFEKQGPGWTPTKQFLRSAIGQMTRDPYARKWQLKLQRRRERAYRRLSKHKILRDTGHLMKSVTGPSTYGFAKISSNSLTVGSNLPYSGYHLTGTAHMPARIFLTAPNQTLERMKTAMLRTLDRLSHP